MIKKGAVFEVAIVASETPDLIVTESPFISKKTDNFGANIQRFFLDWIIFYHGGNIDHDIDNSTLGKLTIKTNVRSNGWRISFNGKATIRAVLKLFHIFFCVTQ